MRNFRACFREARLPGSIMPMREGSARCTLAACPVLVPRRVARGHEAISRRVAERLDRLGEICAAGEPVRVLLQALEGCRACRFLADTEAGYVEAFSVFLEGIKTWNTTSARMGSARHLHLVLARTEEQARKACLIRVAANRLREIAESMLQYDLKLEQLKRELLTRDEKDAYRRGLVMLAGEKAVFSPFLKGM